MQKNAVLGYIKISIITILIMLIIYVLLSMVIQRTVVNGDSMYPTLEDDESILVNKLAYTSGEINRFDVVVFTHYNDKLKEDVHYVKRVIAMPGETVIIDNNGIYIDGELLEEYYGYFDSGFPSFSGLASDYIYVGENQYFVLGDNRNNSEDSRSYGCIDEDVIVGEVAFRIWPLSRIGKIR